MGSAHGEGKQAYRVQILGHAGWWEIAMLFMVTWKIRKFKMPAIFSQNITQFEGSYIDKTCKK